MRAAVLRRKGFIELDQMDEPVPGPGELKIRIKQTGICGSEIHAFEGTHPFRVPPVILGHEATGEVVETGPGTEGWQPGDRVAVIPQIGCSECHYCRQGLENLCNRKTVLGTQAWVGSFAEFITAPAGRAIKLPGHIDDELGALVEPFAVAVHAVRLASPKLGDTALICGAGTIGLATLVAAIEAGIQQAIVTDVLDYNLEAAKALGATAVVNVKRQGLAEVVRDLTNGLGCDVAWVTAGTGPALRDGITSTRKQGKVVVVALFDEPATLGMFDFVGTERVLVGSQMYVPQDFDYAMRILSNRGETVRGMITHRMPIENIQEAFAIATRQAGDAIKVLLHY